jgi:drug/metabolite transporter (DMT)-like permease
MFAIIARSSQVVGIAVTTVSNKMSVIIPILVSILIDPLDVLTNLKVVGIILALIAVFLTIYRERKIDFHPRDIYLPIILFLGMGLVDSLVKYAQHYYVDDNNLALFTVVLFVMAAITGLITKIFRRSSFGDLIRPKTVLWGIALGICNYGSLYFLIRALNHKTNTLNTFDGSIVFGVNNLGIIALSVLFGLIVFKEKLLKINWIGIIISFIAIYILSRT